MPEPTGHPPAPIHPGYRAFFLQIGDHGLQGLLVSYLGDPFSVGGCVSLLGDIGQSELDGVQVQLPGQKVQLRFNGKMGLRGSGGAVKGGRDLVGQDVKGLDLEMGDSVLA